MSVRSSESVTVLFTTRNPNTLVGVNADSLPTGTLYLNGVANGATVTVTNVSTGLYKAAVTLPSLTINDFVETVITATINTIIDNEVIWRDTADLLLDANGRTDVIKIAGTTQTARDIGASVLVGDKTGFSLTQTFPTNFSALSIDSGGVAKANLAQILGTALTETAGLLAAGFKKFFNVSSPTGTLNSLPDAVPGATGALPVGDSAGAVKVQSGTSANQISLSSGAVILQSGTGTGQLDFTSGVVKANLAQILGTALTETSGLLAAAFKKFFNVATPTGTVNSIPDAVAGASGGLFIAGTNAATTASITGNLTGNVSGSVGSVTGNVAGNVVGSTASVSGAVGSVSGNVGGNVVGNVVGNVNGNVVGSVASVTAGVTVSTNNDKTGYTASTVSDKAGYSLSSLGIQAIWDALTSALTTVGSIGKRIADYLTGDAYARLGSPAGASIAADLAEIEAETDDVAAIKAKTDNLPASPAATGDIAAGLTAQGLTTARAGYLDNLNVSGPVASAAALTTAQTEITETGADVDELIVTAASILTAAEAAQTAAETIDVQAEMIALGYTAARAIKMDHLDADVSSAGGGTDPLLNAVPGSYAAGTAGYILGTNLDAPVSAAAGVVYGENGSIDYTYTVFDTNGTTPLEGVSVYVASDLAGVNRSQAKLTDALGQVQFSLDPGTVFFWSSRIDREFSGNPDSQVVS